MSDDIHKNIPTLDDIIHPGDLNKAVIGDLNPEHNEDEPVSRMDMTAEHSLESPSSHTAEEQATNTGAAGQDEASLENQQVENRQLADRRQSSQPLPEGKIERREHHRREADKQNRLDINLLVEKVMQDMMPDLEQHIRMQLRFELEKHLPHSVLGTQDNR